MKIDYKSKLIRYMLDIANQERKNTNIAMFENNPDSTFLDCGCNNGELTLEIAKKIGTKNIYGVDVWMNNIITSSKQGIKCVRHDLNSRLPYANEFFDVVHAGDIIEHLYDTDLFIEEVYRVTRTGGYVVLSTNNLASYHNIFYLLFGKQPTPTAVSDKVVVGGWGKPSVNTFSGPAHRRLFTLGALIGLFECYGFHVEKSKGSGFYPFPIAIARILATINKNHSSHIVVKARKV